MVDHSKKDVSRKDTTESATTSHNAFGRATHSVSGLSARQSANDLSATTVPPSGPPAEPQEEPAPETKADMDGCGTPAHTAAQSTTSDFSSSISSSVGESQAEGNEDPDHESASPSEHEHSELPSSSSKRSAHRVNFAIPEYTHHMQSSRIVDVTDTAEKADISSVRKDHEHDTNFFSSTGTGTTTASTTSDETDGNSEGGGAQQPHFTEGHQFRRRRPLPPHLKALQQNMLNELGQIQVVLENRRVQTMMQNKQQQERAKRERMQQQQQQQQRQDNANAGAGGTAGPGTCNLDNSFLANRINTITSRLKTSSDTTEVVSPPGTPLHD